MKDESFDLESLTKIVRHHRLHIPTTKVSEASSTDCPVRKPSFPLCRVE